MGPGPVGPHIERSLAFASVLESAPSRALDLGSGAGLPGLPLALAWPDTRWVLLDGSVTRTNALRRAVSELGLADRVEVVSARAEDYGRGAERGRFDLVVARSFGPPALTAECSAPLLVLGGQLVVAEPPGGAPGRWPADGLRSLGLAPTVSRSFPAALQTLTLCTACPDRFPRRTGVPAKRPLF